MKIDVCLLSFCIHGVCLLSFSETYDAIGDEKEEVNYHRYVTYCECMCMSKYLSVYQATYSTNNCALDK